MRCIWLTWSFLTLLSAILCTSGCISPYWIKGSFIYDLKKYMSDIGLYRRCTYPVRGSKLGVLHIIDDCGHYSFNDVPHLYWKICLLMLSISTCSLIFLTFLLFTLGFYVDLLKMTNVYKSCQFIQFMAGVMILLSCILYPLGWQGNHEVSQICGPTTSVLSLGRCNVGMAFILTCVGGLIALLGTTIPVLLLKNGCTDVPRCETTEYPTHYPSSLPSTTRDGTVLTAVGTSPPWRPFSYISGTGPPTGGTMLSNGGAATRYSYVSYQSLLPNTTTLGPNSTLLQPTQHMRLLSPSPPSERQLQQLLLRQQEQQLLMQESSITMASSAPPGTTELIEDERSNDGQASNENPSHDDDINRNNNMLIENELE